MDSQTVKRGSAVAPMALSLTALAIVIEGHPHFDEIGAKLCGGSIAVESTEAGGMAFHVWIPSERGNSR